MINISKIVRIYFSHEKFSLQPKKFNYIKNANIFNYYYYYY